jgi:hypothetical protein
MASGNQGPNALQDITAASQFLSTASVRSGVESTYPDSTHGQLSMSPTEATSKRLYGYDIVTHIFDQSIAHFRVEIHSQA